MLAHAPHVDTDAILRHLHDRVDERDNFFVVDLLEVVLLQFREHGREYLV